MNLSSPEIVIKLQGEACSFSAACDRTLKNEEVPLGLNRKCHCILICHPFILPVAKL
jgi:hypothetical protein